MIDETLPNNKQSGQPDNLDVMEQPNHPTPATRVINWIIVAALLVTAIAIGVILKWSFVDENVLVVKNSPFPVRTIREHPTGGGVVFLNVNLCKNTDKSGSVRTSFVSQSREVFLPLSEEHIPKGCLDQELPIVIPKDLVADTYRVKFRVTYQLNPLKKAIVDEFESKEFIVDPISK